MAVHGGLIQPSDAPPTSRSEALFARAKTLMPGGVSSPVRAFRSVGGTPRFISRAQGPYLWDADGHRYVDFVLSWGPMILGHAHPEVVEAVRKQVVDGMSFGAPCALEADLAERIVRMVPSMEMVRFVSSGTEATIARCGWRVPRPAARSSSSSPAAIMGTAMRSWCRPAPASRRSVSLTHRG